MRWASALSEREDLEQAVAECAAAVREQLGGAAADFAAVFVSDAFADRYEEVGALLSERLPSRVLVGCSAGGVIGAGREVESRAGLSLTAASLPGVRIATFAVQDDDLPDLDGPPRLWEEMAGVRAVDDPEFLLLADPFSIHADNLLMGLDYAFPKAAKVGGLASGADGPGRNALYLNSLCLRSGLIGVAFMGDIRLEAVVAQGCRPVGPLLNVTGCRQNVLMSVDGRPPLHVLRDMADSLSSRDKQLLRHSLFLGLAMDPAREKQGQGDFLIRNIVGVDPEQGHVAVGALLRPGQTVRFHLRDARTSTDDLRHMLERVAPGKDRARGALLFSCMGRGRLLYGRPDHDSQLFHETMGPLPLGGFFCNGEIGPVHGTTHLHGYTSSFGIFGPKTTATGGGGRGKP